MINTCKTVTENISATQCVSDIWSTILSMLFWLYELESDEGKPLISYMDYIQAKAGHYDFLW